MTVRGQERGQEEAGREQEGRRRKREKKNEIAPLVCCAAFVMWACNKAQNVIGSNSQPPLWRERRRRGLLAQAATKCCGVIFFCGIKMKSEIALCWEGGADFNLKRSTKKKEKRRGENREHLNNLITAWWMSSVMSAETDRWWAKKETHTHTVAGQYCEQW